MTGDLTEQQTLLLNEFHTRLAETFGITLDGTSAWLRMDGGTVHVVIAGIHANTMRPDCCLQCGGENQLRTATQTIIHANGRKTTWNGMTCVDCRLPQ